MFKLAICDDEKYFSEELQTILSAYLTAKGLDYSIDRYESGKELAALGESVTQYAAVFLDVNMEDMDGIRTACAIREVSSEIFIVFVTAYVSYALEGYKVNAVRYLLKGSPNFDSTVYECLDAIFTAGCLARRTRRLAICLAC